MCRISRSSSSFRSAVTPSVRGRGAREAQAWSIARETSIDAGLADVWLVQLAAHVAGHEPAQLALDADDALQHRGAQSLGLELDLHLARCAAAWPR